MIDSFYMDFLMKNQINRQEYEEKILNFIKKEILPDLNNKFKDLKMTFYIQDYKLRFEITKLGIYNVDFYIDLPYIQIFPNEQSFDKRFSDLLEHEILVLWNKQILKENE